MNHREVCLVPINVSEDNWSLYGLSFATFFHLCCLWSICTTYPFLFFLLSCVSVCWLTCPRKTLLRCTSGVEHEYTHPSSWGGLKSLCLFCQFLCLYDQFFVLYLCRFIIPTLGHLLRIHIHFMVSFCWHVCLVFWGFDILYSCTLS